MAALSPPIDQEQLSRQAHDHIGCFYLIGTSDDQLRTDNLSLEPQVSESRHCSRVVANGCA